jgi:predicted TIM-barrel fold metal-dependent hydrolase
MLYYHPQVYIDFAGLQSLIPRTAFYDAFRSVVEAGYADRIMFESDGTENGVDWLSKGIDAVMEAGFLSDAQRRDILYNNASRFFRLNRPR